MEANIEVPKEEYPFVAFGISWLTEHALQYLQPRGFTKPDIAFLDENPTMAGAEYDLIYWWHKKFTDYSELENRARVRMIMQSRESKKFNSEHLRDFVDFIGDRQEKTPERSWIFRVSRIGIDTQTRQAIGHFYVDPANCWFNLGHTLVMGWDESDSIYLIKNHPTIGPGK
jgi:hypothetical protein